MISRLLPLRRFPACPSRPGAAARPSKHIVAVVVIALLAAACGSAETTGDDVAQADGASAASTPEADGRQATVAVDDGTTATDETGATDASAGGSSATGALAERIVELPPAPEGFPSIVPDIKPIGLRIPELGIDTAAPVVGVGVESNGDMEVPPADEVGWYEFGPTPGAAGSSVLAAHIAFDGVDGVFVNLDELSVGATIEVDYEDGSTATFVATAKEQYSKEGLPRDDIFAKDGDPGLVLITCGGDFNRSLRSYDDNVVVYAQPV